MLTSRSIRYGLCQVRNNTEPWVQYPPKSLLHSMYTRNAEKSLVVYLIRILHSLCRGRITFFENLLFKEHEKP